MKTITLIPILALCLIVNAAYADHQITVKEAQISFTLPDAWAAKPIRGNPSPPKMDASDPLYLEWPRAAIPDSQGRKVEPGINVTVFNVAPNTDVKLISSELMQKRRWSVMALPAGIKEDLKLPNSVGYLAEIANIPGLEMKVFVIHAINDGKFFEICISVTKELLPQVEGELRSIIRSLRIEK